MSSFYFRFYSLSAVVAAAVSQSKKAVSAVAAAVVGIGLFLAPMESVQAQSGVSTVTQVNLSSFSFDSADDLVMSLYLNYGTVALHTYYWSGIYGDAGFWSWISVDGDDEDFRTLRAWHVPSQHWYYYPGNRSDYYVCRVGLSDFDAPSVGGFRIDEDSPWVEVWFGRERRLILRPLSFTTVTAIITMWICLLTVT